MESCSILLRRTRLVSERLRCSFSLVSTKSLLYDSLGPAYHLATLSGSFPDLPSCPAQTREVPRLVSFLERFREHLLLKTMLGRRV